MGELPEGVQLVPPREDGKVVVLDFERPGFTPDYCVHGKASCMGPGPCPHWCLLGDATFRLVSSGAAMPLCTDCAEALLQPEDAVGGGRVRDRRCAQGPH